MALGAIGSDGYKLMAILHILATVVGIGAVFLNGVYGAQAKARKGPEGLAIAEANLRVTLIAEWLIYTIPITGIILVLMSDDVIEFDQTWIWLSIVLYVVALGISHGVAIPTAKRMQVLMRELNAMGPPPGAGGPGGAPGAGGPGGAPGGPPPQVAALAALGKKIGAAGAALNLLTVVLIVLMVWKPGGPGL
ncbi:MAG: hypothetical protein AMXMBFR46_01090 [Acidimicrobiia bacterium]